jgi:hypothetical protein
LRHVNANSQESIVAPFPSAIERDAVRPPLGQKSVDRGEERIGWSAVDWSVASEHPDPRRVRERGEWNDWHERKIGGWEKRYWLLAIGYSL